MNFSDVLKALNQASAFELFRMRAAINRVLDQPQWVDAVRGRLRVGQVVEYFDSQANAACQARIIELRRKQALVLDIATQTRWLISYASINLDGADVQIREQVRRGLGRNEVAVGEVEDALDSRWRWPSVQVCCRSNRCRWGSKRHAPVFHRPRGFFLDPP